MARSRTLALMALTMLGCGSSNSGDGLDIGDMGAPCNHGDVAPPSGLLITYPAIDCDDLICVYGDGDTPPSGPCDNDADCNVANPVTPKFECVPGATANRCQLDMTYVLERSMCSRECASDDDCRGAASDTSCQTGFYCARLTDQGEMCCKKLCACGDTLGDTTEVDFACLDGSAACCEHSPESCG